MEKSWLNRLPKKKLEILASGLYFEGVKSLTRDTILEYIYEIYDVFELPATIGPPFRIFISDKEVIVFQFDTDGPMHNYGIPVLDIYNYNKIIFDKGSITIKKGKKTYIINNIISVL